MSDPLLPANIAQLFIPPSGTEGLSLYLGGLGVRTNSLRITRSLDTLVDGWAANIAWQFGEDPALDKKVRPYSFVGASVFINRALALAGRLYKTDSNLAGRNELNLEGWSFAADLVDSMLSPPYEANKITLRQRAEDMARPFGLTVISDLDVDGQFDRVTANATQRAGAHLLTLAAQRGALINSDPDGALRIFKITEGAEPVATIEEGGGNYSGFKASFDGRARFSEYRFLSQTPGDTSVSAVATDEGVPVFRSITVSGNDTTTGEVQKAADWRKTKALADALTIPIRAEGLTAPGGGVWKPGQIVTLISPTLFIPNGFEMLIRATDMEQTDGGSSTILHLVPPAVYTGAEIAEPWANG